MRERGIIMGPESVRALLAGRKSQTRCVVKGVPAGADEVFVWTGDNVPPGADMARPGVYARKHGPDGWLLHIVSQPFTPGDRLWVKEAFQFVCAHEDDDTLCVAYRASQDGGCAGLVVNNIPRPAGVVAPPPSRGWRSPLYMPRWASRITLEITEVRVQRVQEISEEDARAEGLWRPSDDNPYGTRFVGEMIGRFATAWDRINPKTPWSANPWVWALTFRVVAARAAGEGE